MKTVSDKPEHQPSETHTLDEVLKSLQDLIRNELLDAEPKPPPPPKIQHGKVGRPRKPRPEPVPETEPAAPIDLDEVMRSLKKLVSNDLTDSAEPDDSTDEQAALEETSPPETVVETPTVPAWEAEPDSADAVAPETETMPPPAPLETKSVPGGTQQEFMFGPPIEQAGQEDSMVEITLDSDSLTFDDADTSPHDVAPIEEPDIEFDVEFPDVELDVPDAGEPDPAPVPTADTDATQSAVPEANLVSEDITLEDVLPAHAEPESPSTNAPNVPGVPDATPFMANSTIEFEPTAPNIEPPGEEPPPAESALRPGPETLPDAPAVNAEPAAEESEFLASLESLPEPEIEIAEQPASEPASGKASVPTLGESINFDDLPVLSDVVMPAPEAVPRAPELPFAESEHARQLAIRVVARLNIELRKAGERALDARNIDRLQHILREELERRAQAPANSEKSAGKN